MNRGDKGDFGEACLIAFGYLVGLLGLGVGSYILLLTYAFASMIDPSLSDAARQKVLLDRMFLTSDSWVTYLSFAIILVSLGSIWTAVRLRRKTAKVARLHRSAPVIDDAVTKRWTANQQPPGRIMKSGGEMQSSD
jgi:hypothetical protein